MKKCISRFLCLMMSVFICLISMPANFAFASAPTMIYVNGVDIINNPGSIPSGVTYDSGTSTLTLNNADLNTSRTNGDISHVIYADGDLNIALVGTNTVSNTTGTGTRYGIEVRGNLSITSTDTASLSVTGDSRSFHVEGNLTIGDGIHATSVSTAGEVHSENPGNITVNANSTLTNSSGGVSCNSIDGQGTFPQNNGNGGGQPPAGDPFKLSIDGQVLIDETADPQITSATGTGYEIKEIGFMPGYMINVDTSVAPTLGYIETEGDTQLILNPNGNLTVSANSGYSVNCTGRTDFFVSSGGEQYTVNFEGGIKTSGSVFLNDKAVNLGSSETPSTKGIDCKNLNISFNTVKMYTTGYSLENIEDGVFVEGKSKLEIHSGGIATNNVSSIQVSEGGKVDIYHENGKGTFTPKAAVWPFVDMQGTDEETQDGYIHEPDSYTCVEGTSAEQKYIMTTAEGHFSLESTAKAMYTLSSNIQNGETVAADSLVTNGRVRVLAANGYKQTAGGYTDYVIEEGTEVTIELLPDYGYQYESGGLNGVPTTPEAGKATYTFTMPDNNIHLSAIFERSNDIINVNSNNINSASITVPNGEINGNAKFTVADKTATAAEEQKIDNLANNMSLGAVLDLKLSEEISKNGSMTDTWSSNITQLNDDTNVGLKLDSNLAGYESYKIVRIHDGTAELLPASYNPATGVLSFETDRYSTYAVLYSGEKTTTQTKKVSYNGTDIKVNVTSAEGVIPDGASLSVSLISTESQSSAYNLIKDAVKGISTTILPLNITLKDSNGNSIQPNGKLTISVQVPTGYNNPIICYVSNDGKVTKLATTVKDGYATFEVDHLSYYVLVNQPVAKTGDTTNFVGLIALAATSGTGLVTIKTYKKKKSRYQVVKN